MNEPISLFREDRP